MGGEKQAVLVFGPNRIKGTRMAWLLKFKILDPKTIADKMRNEIDIDDKLF